MSEAWEFGPAAQREIAYGKMIRERLDYDDRTGDLIWRDTRKKAIQYFRSSKNAEIIVDDVKLSAARVVWIWHWGIMPPTRLRHVNNIASDTRIDNLGFFDKTNSIDGSGFRWGVCVPDRWGPFPVAYFNSYYAALANCESVRRLYAAETIVTYTNRGKRKVQNVPSPWGHHVFQYGEWEAYCGQDVSDLV